MRWLSRWRMNRAIRPYAAHLTPWLQRNFGASDNYTPGQVNAGVRALKLDADFICIGFAAFLSEEEFDAHRAEMPVQMTYDDARALFVRFAPPRQPSSGFDEAPETSYATTGDGHLP